jgi:hypothetical protein
MTSVISLNDKRHYLPSTQTGILIAAMVSITKNIALEKKNLGLITHYEA